MHPILFAGAALVGLPVLLHLLLKQEPKRLVFPTVRFLKLAQKTTQRKLRLRHFLLLLLRCLILALMCGALFQPTVPASNAGLAGLNLSVGEPVAAVLILDTSPSMGYRVERRTRLEDAVRRASEFLDALAPSSRIAILTTSDPTAVWEATLADARRRLETVQEPDGVSRPVSAVLRTAYSLHANPDSDGGSLAGEPLPKLVAVFTDRAANSFSVDQVEDLIAAAAAVTDGPVGHVFFDVGVETPTDVAVMEAVVEPSVAAANVPVVVTATVRAVGAAVPAAQVRCVVAGGPTVPPREVALPVDEPVPVTFTLTGLPPGVHQIEVALTTPDALGPEGTPGFNNVRYVTLRVGSALRLLTITDTPDSALLWSLAHAAKQEFEVTVVTPADVPDLNGFDAICLLGVRDPGLAPPGGEPLWAKLKPFVDRGGRVLVVPTDSVNTEAYQPAASRDLLPAGLERIVDRTLQPAPAPGEPDPRAGAEIVFDEPATRHPLLAPIRELQLGGRTDFLQIPRRAWRYWRTTPPTAGSVVARFADSAEPAERTPAILERDHPNGGRVVLLTTRLDDPSDEPAEVWNDYWQSSSWNVFWPNRLARYLAGDGTEIARQFTTGQLVTLPAPKSSLNAPLILEGPGVMDDDDLTLTADGVRLSPTRTQTAGNFRVRTADRSYDEGFSLNPASDESNLEKVPTAIWEALGGPGSVVPAGKGFDPTQFLAQSGGRFPLFPVLMILVLIVFAAEGVLANRFYRRT